MRATEDDIADPAKPLPSLCPSVVERYFVRGYMVNLPKGGSATDFNDVKSNMNDVRILRHSNRICVVTLAPTHPVLNVDTKISSVSFKVPSIIFIYTNMLKYFVCKQNILSLFLCSS